MSAAYNHPEGGSLDIDGTTITVMAENGHAASIQIGPDGLRDLAKKFKAHAADFEYALHLESLSHGEVLRSRKQSKHEVNISSTVNMKRPTIGTLGDVLKEITDHAPDGFTRIAGMTHSRWFEPIDDRETLYLDIDGVTACVDVQSDVTVFIRQGVTVDHARALLKAMAAELKDYPSLEPFTPLTPISLDEVPF